MNITINSQNLDFSLENETTLGEVVEGIQRWLGESGMCIRSIDANGEPIDLSGKSSWDDIPVQDIDQMNVVAQTPFEFRAEKISSLYEYFVTLRDAEDEREVVFDLIAEKDGVKELLEETLTAEIASSFVALCNSLADLEQKSGAAADAPPSLNEPTPGLNAPSAALPELFGDRLSALIGYASELVPVIEARWREIAEPVTTLKAVIPAATESIESLSEVSAYLQTGADSQAMQRVLHFLEIAQSLMRILYAMRERKLLSVRALADETGAESLDITEEDIAEQQSALGGLLDELSTAIDEGDTITIGDLLEYEIGPRFLEIIETLGSKVAN